MTHPTSTRDRDQVLVDTAWVAARLGSPALVLLEVDDRPALYHRSHPPGARLISWAADLQDPIRRDIPDSQAMSRLWRRLGVRHDTTVVFYGDLHNWLAAYGYWLFTAYGLPDVRLLDGGRQRWIAQALPLTRHAPPPVVDRPAPTPALDWSLRASRAQVANAARSASLLDVRTPQEYTGEWLSEPEFPGESAHRPGHIPGAVNVPWNLAVDLEGRIKPTEDLDALYRAVGVEPDHPVVTYCRIGERSAHTWIVLHELLGYPDVRNYDGSWTEWGSMTGMPIQLGPEPGSLPYHFTP